METIFITHSDFLAHHGTKGQKWGVRRYQNEDGSLTSEGRKHYGVGTSNKSKKEQKAALKAKAKREKAGEREKKKAETTAEKVVKDRQRKMEYLRDHPEKMYRHRKELSEDDVSKIMEKVQFDKKLRNIRRDEIDQGMRKIEDVKRRFDTLNNVYQTSKNTYNNIAEVNNALVDMGFNKSGKYMKRWGENEEDFLTRQYDRVYEKMIRTEEGRKDVYEHPEKYTTGQINKLNNRKAAEDKLRNKGNNKQNKGDDDFWSKIKDGDWEGAKEEDPERYEEMVKSMFK